MHDLFQNLRLSSGDTTAALSYVPTESSCALLVGEVAHISDRNKSEDEIDANELSERLVFCFNQQVTPAKNHLLTQKSGMTRSLQLGRMSPLNFKAVDTVFISLI